jgi:hypothetical protein
MPMQTGSWIERLDDEDLAFLKRFLLASGTLKEVARQYGISYPTVRLRLDRLIQKVTLLESMQTASEFERRLRASYADGRMDAETFHKLLQAYTNEREELDASVAGVE